MTTTAPVPSSAAEDLLFNAQKLDEAVNSAAPAYTDRLGVSRMTLAGAVARISAVNPRGAWAATTVYAARDLVTSSGTWYIALDAHTSGASFAGDQAAHWRVYQGVTDNDVAGAAFSDEIGHTNDDASTTTVGDALRARESDIRYKVAPFNNQVAFLGDSITAQGVSNGVIATISTDSRATRNMNRGFSHWVAALTRQNFRAPQALNFGVSGETSAQIAARVDDVVASGAGVCVVLAGTNDIGVVAASVTIANLTTIYMALEAANVMAIAIPILPRDLAANAANSLFVQRVNYWLINVAPTIFSNLYIADARYAYGDPTDGNMAPRAGFSYDGLHPTAIGARYIGKVVADILNVVRPYALAPAFATIWDYYDATHNPGGSLLPNTILGGTSGTKLDANTTGSFANTFQAGFSAGGGTITSLLAAGTKETGGLSSGAACQKIVISGTATGGSQTVFVFEQVNFSGATSLLAGDVVEAVAEIEVEGATIGVSGVCLYVSTTESGNVYTQHDGYPIVSDDYTADPIKAVLRTPARTLGANASAGRCGIWIYFKNTGTTRSITLRIGSIAVRKVV